jgi:hypothetical protein
MKITRTMAILLVFVLMLTAGCVGGEKTTKGTTSNVTTTAVKTNNVTTTAVTTKSTTSGTTTSQTSAASSSVPPLKKGSEAFQQLLTSATPIFTDKFASESHAPDTIASSFYKQTAPSTRNVSYTDGMEGKGIHLDNYNSYIGYPAGTVREREGTIRFFFKPDADIFQSYNKRQSVWTNFGTIAPPYTAFLVDTVGWNAAFSGGYCAFLTFKEGDGNYSYMSFGTWSGSDWSTTASELTPTIKWDSNKWYDIVISYSMTKGKTAVHIDSYLAGEAKYNTALSQTEGFFLGQDPWKMGSTEYWPYGPHALKGTYSYLRIYDQAIMD